MSQDPEDDDGPAKTVFEPSPRPAGGGKSAAEDAWFSGEPGPAAEPEARARQVHKGRWTF